MTVVIRRAVASFAIVLASSAVLWIIKKIFYYWCLGSDDYRYSLSGSSGRA